MWKWFLPCAFMIGLSTWFAVDQYSTVLDRDGEIIRITTECRQPKIRKANVEKTLKETYEFLSEYEVRSYSDVFIWFSDKYGVPWELYAALVRIESNFDPAQKSDRAAIGMTQVLESTGRATAKTMGIKYREGKTLWNDVLNMAIGFTYLSGWYCEASTGGVSQDSAIHYAIRRYLGGPNVEINMSKSTEGGKAVRQYVHEYNETMWQEYRKLRYIHKAISLEATQ